MSDVDRLLTEYIAEHQAGGDADPLAYLDRVTRTDRLELEALIDGYLAHAPRQAIDAAAYEGSLAEKIVESLAPSLTGVSGMWPTVLPELRNRARIKRKELVAQLASALGFPDREAKVGDYYHQMEAGVLPVEGVSMRVLDALGSIVGESAERLREMGGALAPGGEATVTDAVAFARVSAAPAAAAPLSPAERSKDWDDVDELFRGVG